MKIFIFTKFLIFFFLVRDFVLYTTIQIGWWLTNANALSCDTALKAWEMRIRLCHLAKIINPLQIGDFFFVGNLHSPTPQMFFFVFGAAGKPLFLTERTETCTENSFTLTFLLKKSHLMQLPNKFFTFYSNAKYFSLIDGAMVETDLPSSATAPLCCAEIFLRLCSVVYKLLWL